MREASSAIGSSLRATGEKGSTKILHQATSNLHEAGGRDWYRTHGPSHLFLSYGRRGCARLRKTFIAGPPHARVVVAFDACPAIQDLPASSAIVRSPLTAASATFALNPALCFFRVRFMSCSCASGAF
jgi:hypothetical protein